MSSLAQWRLPSPFRTAPYRMFACRASARDVTIRSARPEDRERVARAFRALHPQAVYQRFFFPKKALSDRELRWLTEPDGERKVALVATTNEDGQEIVVGLGQYIRSGPSADVAFVVAADYQGRGIAARLLRNLADIARTHGVALLEADVLADNTAMLTVLRRSRLSSSETEEDGVIHLALSIDGSCGDTAWVAPQERVRTPDTPAHPCSILEVAER